MMTMTMTITYDTNISNVTIEGNVVKKTYDVDQCGIEVISKELFCLNLLDGHKGFPKIVDVLIEYPKCTLFMENLGNPIRRPDHPVEYFIKILKLVAVLHKHHIVHCDLKPDNILVDSNGNVSIIDFSHSSIATKFDTTKDHYGRSVIDTRSPDRLKHTKTPCTELYTSPESTEHNQTKSYAHDVWSLGCTFYEIITGDYLLDEDDYREKINKIEDNTVRQLIRMMLEIDQSKRPTVLRLLGFLGTPYDPPQIFGMSANFGYYQRDDSRLRCFDLSLVECYFVDQIIEYVMPQMCEAYGEMYVNRSDPEYRWLYDKCAPKTKYTIYDLHYMVHLLILYVCGDFECDDGGCIFLTSTETYLRLVWCLTKCYRLSIIFQKSEME
jgi:serine/threonine protein kinase